MVVDSRSWCVRSVSLNERRKPTRNCILPLYLPLTPWQVDDGRPIRVGLNTAGHKPLTGIAT